MPKINIKPTKKNGMTEYSQLHVDVIAQMAHDMLFEYDKRLLETTKTRCKTMIRTAESVPSLNAKYVWYKRVVDLIEDIVMHGKGGDTV